MGFGQGGGKAFARRVKSRLLYRHFRQNWNIAVTNHPVTAVAGLEGTRKQRDALSDLAWMEETRGTFAADPFIMPSGPNSQDLTILYEHFDWDTEKGRICSVSFNRASKTFGRRQETFESDAHLSYPFLFDHDGRCLFLPEHSQSGDLSIYDIGGDGAIGDKHTVLPGTGLVDSTIVFWNDRYWMFATLAGERDNTHLHIFHAPDLMGPWKAHERNPVKVDRSNARPAGQPIIHRGALFRPAQDCVSHYGSGVVVNEVTVLTETDFAEKPVAEIRPDPGSRYDFGLHTISYADGITVIDGARLESRLHPAFDRLSSYLR